MSSKILVVDDEPYMHQLLQHHLERAGFQVINANTGHEAIALAEREAPSLIVMDVMMAGMDGLSALKQLKKSATTKSIPVIVVTASAHNVAQLEAEASGAAQFLYKPFSPTQLLAAVRALVPEANGPNNGASSPQP